MAVRVLIVDDTDHVRFMLEQMLSFDGFDVVGTAGNAEEAVALAVERDPQVVVTDLRMPGVDGLETTRMIRARRPNQPVVLYTAYLDPAIEKEARAAGVTLCLPKIEGLPRLERELSRLALELSTDDQGGDATHA